MGPRAENLVPTEIRSRTVQPVVSGYPTELPFPISVALNKVKVKVSLEEATKVQRWSRGLVVIFL